MDRVSRLPVLLTLALLAWAGAQTTFDIELNGMAQGVVPADVIAHVYVLRLPAGVPRLTIAVDGLGDDADLAVFLDEQELFDDVSLDPNPTFSLDRPAAGRYEVHVKNLYFRPLRYELHVSGGPPSATAAPSGGGANAGAGAPATVTVARRAYAPSETVRVAFAGTPGNARDWVGLYREDAADRNFLTWQYTRGARDGELTFTLPADPGRYQFRLFDNDGYRRLGTSETFAVGQAVLTTQPTPPTPPALPTQPTPPTPPPPPPTQATTADPVLVAAAAAVAPGAAVGVDFRNAPGNAQDWIGLYREDADDRQYLTWQYTRGPRDGRLTFTAPDEPGHYVFRLFENNGYRRLAQSAIVAVMPAAPVAADVAAVALSCDARADGAPFTDVAVGAGLVVACPSGCPSSGRLWGSDVYTHDSMVCLAARHAGVIGDRGGPFLVRIGHGQASYAAATRNGIASTAYGTWGRSFTVAPLDEGAAEEAPILPGTWDHIAHNSRGSLAFIAGPAGWQGIQRLGGELTLQDVSFDGQTLRFVAPAGAHTQRYVGGLTVVDGVARLEGTFTQDSTGAAEYRWSAQRRP